MKELPILFKGPMVRALIAGTKTQTRRIVVPQPTKEAFGFHWRGGKQLVKAGYGADYIHTDEQSAIRIIEKFSRYKVGDRLWVKETFCKSPDGIIYRATESDAGSNQPDDYCIWKPSIFMPRSLSRITLEVTAVRVERLQDITEEDAIAEGIEQQPDMLGEGSVYWKHYTRGAIAGGAIYDFTDPRSSYATLWDSINGKTYPWDSSPFVFVYGLKQLEGK